jgi:hypothetical protein
MGDGVPGSLVGEERTVRVTVASRQVCLFVPFGALSRAESRDRA